MWLLLPNRLDRSSSIRQFIFRNLVQQFAVKIVVAIMAAMLLSEVESGDAGLLKAPVAAIISAVLIAPPLETLLLQSAPIEIVRRLRRRRWVQLAAGTVPFALLHFLGGIVAGVAAGVVGGLFFSHAYLECRERSWWTAAWVTTTIHALHNLIVLPVALAFA